MVSPDISRKMAKLFPMLMAMGMTITERFELAKRLEKISTLSELDPYFINKIIEAEQMLKSGVSDYEVMKNRQYLKDASDSIKANSNCLDSEKVGKHPCSGGIC